MKHILIIPDGNRRWARKRGKLPYMGHMEGAKTVEKILKGVLELDVSVLTIWGASVSNIKKRSAIEVAFLMKIFKEYFKKLSKNTDVEKHGIKIKVIGKWEKDFPVTVKQAINSCIKATERNTKRTLVFLLDYSGTDEMEDAIKRIAREKEKNPALKIDGDCIKRNLWTADLPPVDLVIRTGGEPHLSTGVMMWDIAEARLHFTETLWPDFTIEELKKAIDEFTGVLKRAGA